MIKILLIFQKAIDNGRESNGLRFVGDLNRLRTSVLKKQALQTANASPKSNSDKYVALFTQTNGCLFSLAFLFHLCFFICLWILFSTTVRVALQCPQITIPLNYTYNNFHPNNLEIIIDPKCQQGPSSTDSYIYLRTKKC